MKNTSKTLKIVSILTVVFYALVILIPLSIKGILAVSGYSTGIIRLPSILMMICAAILAAAVFVDKEPVRTIICVAACAVGAAGIAVFGNHVTIFVDSRIMHYDAFPELLTFEVILSGYPFLALMALAAYPGQKTKKGKGFRAVCYVIALFLLAGVVGNIYKMTFGMYDYTHNHYGIFWDRVYFDIALLVNSIACVLWGWRRILQNKTRADHKEEGGGTL